MLRKTGILRILRRVVSILTRAEARVLLSAGTWRSSPWCFNPHPRRGAGAAQVLRVNTPTSWFQSSPAPRRGCCHTKLNDMLAHALFQSSPAPRRGCCYDRANYSRPVRQFQSSPAPRRGCCMRLSCCDSYFVEFQSSPAPRRGCCDGLLAFPRNGDGFNPHPRRGAGAADGPPATS